MASADPTTLFSEWRHGKRAALDELFPLVYEELRRRAHGCLRGERDGHTLATTALVHETYLKLLDANRLQWQDRAHFLALASMAMRQVLVSYARNHRAAKRGGGQRAEEIDPQRLDGGASLSLAEERAAQMLAIDSALERLAGLNERLSRVVELRFFGGMSVEEIAVALDLATSTVKLDWSKAKAWLYRELESA